MHGHRTDFVLMRSSFGLAKQTKINKSISAYHCILYINTALWNCSDENNEIFRELCTVLPAEYCAVIFSHGRFVSVAFRLLREVYKLNATKL